MCSESTQFGFKGRDRNWLVVCAQDKSILDTPAVILKLPLRVGNLCTLWKYKSTLWLGFTSQQNNSACNSCGTNCSNK